MIAQRDRLALRTLETRMPPVDIELEEQVLGQVLMDLSAISLVAELLPVEAFYTAAHQELYRAALTLHHAGKPADFMSVATWLSDRGLLDKVGGRSRIRDLVEPIVSAYSVAEYANLLNEKYQRRKLIEASNQILRAAYDTSKSLEEVFSLAEEQTFAVTQQQSTNNVQGLPDLALETFAEIEQVFSGERDRGISCGFYDLDAMTQGFQRSDLIIVAGRPSLGKTAFSLNIAQNIAAFHKLPTLFFSLEMSKKLLGYRMLSGASQIESGRLRSARIAEQEWHTLSGAVATLSSVPLYVDDTPNPSVSQMRSTARRVQAHAGSELGLIVIDYLQLMEGGSDNRVQELSKITRSLKGMARELNVPVIALSQLSRGVESRTNKRPMMSDLRESGAIEQDADLILMMYRDEYYNPDTPDRGIAEVIICKHRNGPTGTIKLLFEPQYNRFKNLVKRHD